MYIREFENFYPNPLYYASLLGMYETIKYLLGCEMGKCMNAAASSLTVNVPEETVCHIIERLISAGAGIKSANRSGVNALHQAVLADSSVDIEILPEKIGRLSMLRLRQA